MSLLKKLRNLSRHMNFVELLWKAANSSITTTVRSTKKWLRCSLNYIVSCTKHVHDSVPRGDRNCWECFSIMTTDYSLSCVEVLKEAMEYHDNDIVSIENGDGKRSPSWSLFRHFFNEAAPKRRHTALMAWTAQLIILNVAFNIWNRC